MAKGKIKAGPVEFPVGLLWVVVAIVGIIVFGEALAGFLAVQLANKAASAIGQKIGDFLAALNPLNWLPQGNTAVLGTGQGGKGRSGGGVGGGGGGAW